MMIYRMIVITEVEALKARLQAEGLTVRVRYRGPHGKHQDTPKSAAKAATLYAQ